MTTLSTHPAFAAHLSRVQSLSRSLGNENTPDEEIAAGCLCTGRPAYWNSASVYHAIHVGLLPYLNEGNGVEAAFRSFARDYQKPGFETTIPLLDRLIPLNDAAVADLMAAYEICGTFRDRSELLKRDVTRADEVARDHVEGRSTIAVAA